MIKLKLSLGGDTSPEQNIDIVGGELLEAAVARALSEVPLNGRPADEVFHVLVNGHFIEKDFWPLTQLKEQDTVLISPKVMSGESGQIFKSVLIIAITIVASAVLTPAGGATIGSALLVGAVTVGASLLLNALIPPPVAGAGADLGIGAGYESSQMYSLNGQSNSIKRFEIVPRVYGQHRMFPNVAATPYAELEVDQETGALIQYLYCIYDFGIGPVGISNILIGDTPLTPENFADYHYNLVDFNRAETPEGYWDRAMVQNLQLYKGVSEGENLAIGLDGNQAAGDPLDAWQAIRNTATNDDEVEQEIILNFVNPNGLYGYNATGTRSYRQIEMQIQFASVDAPDTWYNYNDLTKVKHFSATGGQVNLFEFNAKLADLGPTPNAYYTQNILDQKQNNFITHEPVNSELVLMLKSGQNKIVIEDNIGILIGQPVFYKSTQFLGNIQSVAVYGPNPAYRIITLDRNIAYSFVLFDAYSPPSSAAFVYKGVRTITYATGFGGNTYIVPHYTWDSTASNLANGFIRSAGDGPGHARIRREEAAPVYSSFRFTPRTVGQYRVRVQRTSTSGPYGTTVADKLTWSTLTTRFNKAPINTTKRHTFMELKIRATSQLNGTIQNLSANVESIVDVYDPDTATWSKQPSRNPAWVFADLLTGSVNKKAVPKSRLHLPSLVEWAQFCDAVPDPTPTRDYTMPRFESNFVLDYNTTLQDVLNQVAGAAQASLNIIDGKYGVLIDRYRSTPVQIFTPRNSKDFSSVRVYSPRPHGLKIKYIDPNSDWAVSEIIAYDDGYNALNATEFEELTSFACTNDEQAWRFGRYMIAQNKLRQETISILVDFEHMVCTRGDFVQITQDIMRVGGTPARVKSIVGTVVTINDGLVIDGGLTYGYVFRAADGQIRTNTCTPLTPETYDLDGLLPAPGDLIVIGEVGSIVYDCIVKSISPNDDLSANITLIEKADAVYAYESTDVLPDYDPQISASSNPDIAPPNEVQNLAVADNGYDCNDNGTGYKYFIDLVWNVPIGSIFELFSVLADFGQGYNEVGTTRGTTFQYIVDAANLGVVHNFKVLAVAANGNKLDLGAVAAVTATPLSKTSPPSDVERLDSNITNEVLQLSWPQIADCDSKEYLIKYSPLLDGTWGTSLPLLRVDRRTTLASTQARTGTYLIKAVDFNGNVSTNEAVAITTIPKLFNLNEIEVVSESPDFDGGFDRTEKVGSAVILAIETGGPIGVRTFYAEGFYYYKEIVDLGDIYTARIQSSIQAAGYADGDLMSEWLTLDSVLLLSNAAYGDWDVETQYRSTNTLNVIEEWTTLASIAALNEGVGTAYTPWRTFTMGDATGRVFQFRLRLTSNKLTVTPRVFDGTIRVDMPDRVEAYQNLTSSAVAGYVLAYDPAFAGPAPSPNVQVSIDSAQTGDYWAFDYKNLTGFSIRFYDKNNVQVSRQFDIAIKGYGHKHTSVI